MAGPGGREPAPGAVAVRAATPRDAKTIVAFVMAVAHESEERALDEATVARGVGLSLSEPAHRRYFVAERDGAAVGGVLVTTEWSDWTATWYWWLQSVYVVPEARRTGVLEALVDHVDASARREGVRLVRLYMHDGNRRARRAYRRIGYREAPYQVFERPP